MRYRLVWNFEGHTAIYETDANNELSAMINAGAAGVRPGCEMGLYSLGIKISKDLDEQPHWFTVKIWPSATKLEGPPGEPTNDHEKARAREMRITGDLIRPKAPSKPARFDKGDFWDSDPAGWAKMIVLIAFFPLFLLFLAFLP